MKEEKEEKDENRKKEKRIMVIRKNSSVW